VSTSIQKEVSRQLNNMASVPMYQSTMNKAEVEYLLGELSGTVFCQGHLRTIHADPITDNLFKVYTRSFA